jgi:hypothetical protein
MLVFESINEFGTTSWALFYLKDHHFSTFVLGIVLSKASWFFIVVFGHYVFTSVVVFWHYFWAPCFFKCCGFSTLFMGSALFQAPWFFNLVF